MIPRYPECVPIDLIHRTALEPNFQKLLCGISEFTFANLFLFRRIHNYALTTLESGLVVITGSDRGSTFFMLPFGIPQEEELERLFDDLGSIKAACEESALELADKGLSVREDRDNFDYLYLKEDLATLAGGRFRKKRNRVKLFTSMYSLDVESLTPERIDDALKVLEAWLAERAPEAGEGDYVAAHEALVNLTALHLSGAVYYLGDTPIAYTSGEEMPLMDTFVTHFEKGLSKYKGLMQFVNQDFARRLSPSYRFINREQDLGDLGLRQAKSSYRPFGFVKKFIIQRTTDK